MLAKNFFTPEQKENIKQAIMRAELETSGEIRVHIENVCTGDVMDRAAYIFEKLDMHKTNLRNGVLFYLAIKDRKFAIIGDSGINMHVGDDFWGVVKNKMLDHFKTGDFTEGLTEGITMTGVELKKYFPYKEDDINELTDDISFGEN